jgi:predicted Rdx family selenoprotein
LRPITCCVHVIAFYYPSKKNHAKHFISQTILMTFAISLFSVFPYTTYGSLEFNISCAQIEKVDGWHRPQSSAFPFAQSSLTSFNLPKALVPSADHCAVFAAS